MAWYDLIETPLGPLLIGGSAAGLHRIDFLEGTRDALDEERWVARLERDAGERVTRDAAPAAPAARQLREYFAGARREFDLPLAARGSDFQRRVWRELERIPYGAVTSYGVIAAALGQPKASRAVGAANGRNPLSIVVPCHRVIGANGTLTGYGGGLDRKHRLLAIERSAMDLAATPRAGAA
jgi:methylated-DNA-[protein]-cysteine S-methyltransferase